MLFLNRSKYQNCSFGGFVCIFCFQFFKNQNQLIYLYVFSSSGYHSQRSIFWTNAERSEGPALKYSMCTRQYVWKRGRGRERQNGRSSDGGTFGAGDIRPVFKRYCCKCFCCREKKQQKKHIYVVIYIRIYGRFIYIHIFIHTFC